jgi:hypothetical protein
MMIRYGLTIGIAALAAWLLFVPAGAQKVAPGVVLAEETPHTFVIQPGNLQIHRVRVGSDFRPAGELPDPYVYAQTMMVRWAPTGGLALSYTSIVPGATNTRADDAVLFGGAAVDPGSLGYDTSTPVACISEIDVLLVNAAASDVTVNITLDIHPWTGIFGAGALSSIFTMTATGVTLPANSLVLLTFNVAAANNGNPLPVPKAFWVKLTAPFGTPTTVGWIISNSVPGNTSYLPGRGYFRTDPTATGGLVFTVLPQGSLAMAIRGTHNFVGQLDLGALAGRAKPKDLWNIEIDADDDEVEEGLRRNLVDITLTNDSGGFSSRFTTYIDENGRFTLPVDAAISQIKVHRWDNALAATFNRPDTGWSTDPCSPTNAGSVTVLFGDVNGDGVIDDADLLIVLFGFGTGE